MYHLMSLVVHRPDNAFANILAPIEFEATFALEILDGRFGVISEKLLLQFADANLVADAARIAGAGHRSPAVLETNFCPVTSWRRSSQHQQIGNPFSVASFRPSFQSRASSRPGIPTLPSNPKPMGKSHVGLRTHDPVVSW